MIGSALSDPLPHAHEKSRSAVKPGLTRTNVRYLFKRPGAISRDEGPPGGRSALSAPRCGFLGTPPSGLCQCWFNSGNRVCWQVLTVCSRCFGLSFRKLQALHHRAWSEACAKSRSGKGRSRRAFDDRKPSESASEAPFMSGAGGVVRGSRLSSRLQGKGPVSCPEKGQCR